MWSISAFPWIFSFLLVGAITEYSVLPPGSPSALETRALADTVISGVVSWADRVPVRQENRLRRDLISGPTALLDLLSVHATSLGPGKAPHASHVHDDREELLIIRQGTLQVSIGQDTTVLGPGSIACILPGDRHGWVNAGTDTAIYYILHFKSRNPMDLERGKAAGASFTVDFDALTFKAQEKGGVRSYFNRPTAMFEYFEMHMTTLKEGIQSHPPHTHVAEEIILMMQGASREFITDTQYPAGVGDVIFLGSESLHAIENAGKGEASYFAFQWR